MGDDGRHRLKALKRWRRIILWLEQMLEARRWKLQGGPAATGDSMYDLEWDDDEGDAAGLEQASGMHASRGHRPGGAAENQEALPTLCIVEDDLLRQLQDDELHEWARAHAAAAILGREGTEPELCRNHAQCVVQASAMKQLPR